MQPPQARPAPRVPSEPSHGPAAGLFGSTQNVGDLERIASAVGGGVLALYGLSRGSLGGVALAAAGGVLVHRGVSGHCPAFAALGVSTAGEQAGPAPVEVNRSVTVNKPRAEVYAFWRELEHLPRFMEHLRRVEALDAERSRWTAKGPGPAPDLTWEARITEERENEALAWESLPGADVHNAGHVRFADAPGGGTEVHVRIGYRPPAGPVGATVAGWLSPVLHQMVKEDVRRFKHLLEAGEVPRASSSSAARPAE
ncbi:MAG: SRPBCC family protein [Rhodothermales bacterium]|nr:SRPBCC family protein [Rhodothermales bacterium]